MLIIFIFSAALEVITTRLATSSESVQEYFSNTLLSCTQDAEITNADLTSSLEELHNLGLISQDSFDNYEPTQLAKAIVASALDPDDGIFIQQELARALRAFVMDGDMHILYTFTPIQDFGLSVNWQVFRDEMHGLDESGIRVLGFLGIKPTIILKL